MRQIKHDQQRVIIYTTKQLAIAALLFVLCGLIFLSTYFMDTMLTPVPEVHARVINSTMAKDTVERISITALDEIRYGRELIINTSKYFGPKGKVARLSNGMNCQNCHLQAGTKLFANNYAVFYANYPKQGARSGKRDEVTDRISDCFQRSLAGRMPDKNSKEIKAMVRYFAWIGAGTKKGQKIYGTATEKLPFLDRAADPMAGKLGYQKMCKSCHGENGEGLKAPDQLSYTYPPLWGKNSYSDAAGMYRLSNFAGFVKNNMPFGADFRNPQLSNEEAWDVAAYVNTRPRPHKDQQQDYPDLSKKPLDAPYGPYQDEFSEQQHKFGPFKPIAAYAKSQKTTGKVKLAKNH